MLFFPYYINKQPFLVPPPSPNATSPSVLAFSWLCLLSLPSLLPFSLKPFPVSLCPQLLWQASQVTSFLHVANTPLSRQSRPHLTGPVSGIFLSPSFSVETLSSLGYQNHTLWFSFYCTACSWPSFFSRCCFWMPESFRVQLMDTFLSTLTPQVTSLGLMALIEHLLCWWYPNLSFWFRPLAWTPDSTAYLTPPLECLLDVSHIFPA